MNRENERLKNKILEMAIKGKLVKQDPNDEPASVLLDKIKEEREKLIAEKKIRREKYSEIYKDTSDNHYYEKFEDGTVNDITEEIPFDIPESWKWCRLGFVCPIIFSGKSPKYSQVENDNFVLGQKNNQPYGIDLSGIKYATDEFIKNYPKDYYVQNHDIFLNTLGNGTVGRIGIFNISNNNKYITDGHIFVMRTLGILKEYYLYYHLKLFQNNIENSAEGSTNQVFLKIEKVKKYLIAIPPEKEQIRIIDKLNQLFVQLNNKNKKEDKIKFLKEVLKSKIINEAIQGNLVKQDPNDEPAEVLINKILNEKRELIKTKQIKKENLSVIYKDSTDNQFYEKFDDGKKVNITDEIPFSIPDNWTYTRMHNVIELLSGRDLTPTEYNDNNIGIPYLTGASNIEKNMLIINRWTNFPKVIAKKNDLLLTCKGTVGTTIILKEEKVHIARQIMALRKSSALEWNYLKIVVDSYISLLKSRAKSMIPGISREDVLNLIIPIPPLLEQIRIINKIREILKYIETAG